MKNYIVLLVILALLVGGTVVWMSRSSDTPNQVGALAGPDIPYTWLKIGGLLREYRSQNMLTATTSLCALLSPAATSTLDYVSWQITTGTSTAASITIATSTSPYATSTTDELVADTSVASGKQGYSYWTSAGGAVDDARIGPNTYLLVKTSTGGLGGYTYSGKCQAQFTVLQ